MSSDIFYLLARSKFLRAVAGGVTLLALAACASGARTGAMTVPLSPDQIIADNSPLKNAISVGKVEGGDETNPLWKSEVSNGNFKSALEDSLALAALKAPTTGSYVLNAKLIALKQPFAGFDMTVTSTVEYKMMKGDKPDPVMSETVVTPYTANFSDAFVGMERLRLANEGAMRTNIKEIISRIIKAGQPDGVLSAPPAAKVSSLQ